MFKEQGRQLDLYSRRYVRYLLIAVIFLLGLSVRDVYGQQTLTKATTEIEIEIEIEIEPSKQMRVAVIYPDVREPYLSIFKTIVKGVGDELGIDVASRSIDKKENISVLAHWIEQQQVGSVIALGNAGLKIAHSLGDQYDSLVGAVMINDQNQDVVKNVISMTPAPNRLFEKLLDFAPNTKRICVVYDPESQGWLIKQAQLAADENNLQLHAVPASDTRSAAIIYRDLLSEQKTSHDALWLLQGDQALKERSVLYMILQHAWDNDLVVFSSNPSHVKKGALFSLYPDNKNLGRSLAKAVLEINKGQQVGVRALEDLLIAVNIRTAEHLGISISRSERREFEMVFPAR